MKVRLYRGRPLAVFIIILLILATQAVTVFKFLARVQIESLPSIFKASIFLLLGCNLWLMKNWARKAYIVFCISGMIEFIVEFIRGPFPSSSIKDVDESFYWATLIFIGILTLQIQQLLRPNVIAYFRTRAGTAESPMMAAVIVQVILFLWLILIEALMLMLGQPLQLSKFLGRVAPMGIGVVWLAVRPGLGPVLWLTFFHFIPLASNAIGLLAGQIESGSLQMFITLTVLRISGIALAVMGLIEMKKRVKLDLD